MSTEDQIGRERVALEEIRRKLESTTLNSVRKVLPDRAIHEACEAVGHTYRKRVLTPVVTVLHMILAAIWPEESFAASWQVIWGTLVSRLGGASGKSPTASSVTRARGRLPLGLWQRLFAWLSQQAEAFRLRSTGGAVTAWFSWTGPVCRWRTRRRW